MKKSKLVGIVCVIAMLAGLLAAGCAGEAPPTEGLPEVKTLKIGMIESLNWPIGTDAVHVIELDVERTNADGGLLIGGERYKLELIADDNKMDLGLSKTVAEKQIFQDKVKFIVGDGWCDSYFDLAEENGVVVAATPITPEIYDPKYHPCTDKG